MTGGGGGAGGLVQDYNASNIPAGNYTISIGAGGPGVFNNPGGTNAPPTSPPTGAFTVLANPGSDSTFGPTPVGTITAKGGGRGGRYRYYGSPGPSYPYPANPMSTHFWGAPGGSGGGGAFTAEPAPTQSPRNPGGSGFSYPSPNQQGHPGGSTMSNPTAPGPTSKGGAGGGGAGGAGGSINPYNVWHFSGGGGGSGKASPQFPGPGLALLGLPIPMTNEMGPSGTLAGGGAGGNYVSPGSAYPTNPGFWSPPSSAVGGSGGGGDSYYNLPSYPSQTQRQMQAGHQHMGGGGGCGPGPGGPTGNLPTPAPGDWYGAPGGSGVMMFRYAHPGS